MSRLDDEIEMVTTELNDLYMDYVFNACTEEETTTVRSQIDKLETELTRLQFIQDALV